MALQTSGPISLADIQTEFGGSNPISLSEYYGGGTYVPAGANPGIATSGAINMNSFYGGVAATVLTISSNVNNYDIGAQAIAAGGDKSTPVILTINAGVTVGSTSSSTPAMYTGTGWGSGTTINITNNGSIVGVSGSNTSGSASGGNGGRGGGHTPNAVSAVAGGAGSSGSGGSADAANNGGNAFEHSQTSDNNLLVIFDTAGTRIGGSAGTKTIYGGGGGGGGGGTNSGWWSNYKMQFSTGGGGGGGRGTTGGSGGLGGPITSFPHRTYTAGSSGGSGTSSNYGSGGAGGSNYGVTAGAGGRGGSLGSSGVGGVTISGIGNVPAASGGSGGANGSASGISGSVLSGNTAQIT